MKLLELGFEFFEDLPLFKNVLNITKEKNN